MPPDSTGKRGRAVKRTVEGIEVYEEVTQEMNRGIAEIPPNMTTTKITIGEDVSGNVREVKAFDGTTLLFTLTISKAGSVVTTYDITRT